MFKHYINAELREETPSAEEPAAPTGTPPPPPPPEETPPEPTPPVDEGKDVIPDEEDLWADMAQDDEASEDLETEEPVTPPAVEEPTPTPPVEPTVEPDAEPPAPTEPVATPPVETPPVVPEEQPPATPPEPTVTPPTEEETQAAHKLQMDDTITALTARFQISEEESLQLVTEPGKVFPKLQARMFADMWEHMTAMIRQNLPAAIEYHTQAREVQNKEVDSFFARWPKLNRAEHGATVAKVSGVFNQLNPNATEEDILNHVGMQTMMLHGIAPDMIPAPPTETPSATPPLAPHVPAAVNGGRPAPTQQSVNIWTEMSEEIDDD